MAKKKLQHFAEMKTFDCVFEPSNQEMIAGESELRGNWSEAVFKNANPITLELGCGKGEYTIALAKKYPNQNFIGVDVKGARLWRGSKTADEEGIKNVAFLRTKVEFIETFFAPLEVAEVWLTFSDPQPKDRKGTKRITSEYFLKKYQRILNNPKTIHLKTDSSFLYERTLEALNSFRHEKIYNTSNLYATSKDTFTEKEWELLNVKTFYEQKFLNLGSKIHYIKAILEHHED